MKIINEAKYYGDVNTLKSSFEATMINIEDVLYRLEYIYRFETDPDKKEYVGNYINNLRQAEKFIDDAVENFNYEITDTFKDPNLDLPY